MSIRKWFIRNKYSIVAIVLFIINCMLFCCEIYEKEIFIGFVASIATIYLGVIKYQIENDRFYLELFKNFNGRYNGDINDVFNGFENNTIQLDLDDKDKDKKLIIIDYFNLCAEEYYWYKQNRIPEEVWTAWLFGINKNLFST